MQPCFLGHGLLSYTGVTHVTVTKLPGVVLRVVLGVEGWGGTD